MALDVGVVPPITGNGEKNSFVDEGRRTSSCSFPSFLHQPHLSYPQLLTYVHQLPPLLSDEQKLVLPDLNFPFPPGLTQQQVLRHQQRLIQKQRDWRKSKACRRSSPCVATPHPPTRCSRVAS